VRVHLASGFLLREVIAVILDRITAQPPCGPAAGPKGRAPPVHPLPGSQAAAVCPQRLVRAGRKKRYVPPRRIRPLQSAWQAASPTHQPPNSVLRAIRTAAILTLSRGSWAGQVK